MPNQHTSSIAPRQHISGRPVWFIGFAVLLTGIFFKPLVSLIVHAAHNGMHSHILLVPFITAYLIYIRRETLPKEFIPAPGWAMILFIVGAAAAVGASPISRFGQELSQNDFLSLTTVSFICLLGAGGFLFLGGKWMAAAAFPIAFLIFAVPLPDGVVDSLETASQLASTEAADFFFNVTGTPVLRDGTYFQLPAITIQVAQECSGIRSSWILVMTSLLAANLFLKSPWRRAVLVLFTIPLGILRNGFRVWTIGTLCIRYGPHMIQSVIHRRGGPLFFVLALGPLFLLLWWLRRGEMPGFNQGVGRLPPTLSPIAEDVSGQSQPKSSA